MKSAAFILLLILKLTVLAQSNQKTISEELINTPKTIYGITLGGNFSTVNSTDNDTVFSQNFNSKLGGHLGFKVSYSLNKVVQFQTGAQFDIKGFRESSAVISGTSITTNYHTFYLSIPAAIQLNYTPKNTSWGLFGKTGLFYGVAVQGYTRNKSNTSSNLPPTAIDRDLNFGTNSSDDQKRTELGYLLGGGFIFETFDFGIIYEQSFNSIAPNNDNGLRITNNILKVSFTYFFTKNQVKG